MAIFVSAMLKNNDWKQIAEEAGQNKNFQRAEMKYEVCTIFAQWAILTHPREIDCTPPRTARISGLKS